MQSPHFPKDYKTVYLYKDNRLRHRYEKKNNQSNIKSQKLGENHFETPKYPELMKTLDYREHD